MSQKKFDELVQFLQHAENVGEQTAELIAEEIDEFVEGVYDFSDQFYYDPSFRGRVGQVSDVGKKTMESIYELVESIEEGETEVAIDNTGQVRVMYRD